MDKENHQSLQSHPDHPKYQKLILYLFPHQTRLVCGVFCTMLGSVFPPVFLIWSILLSVFIVLSAKQPCVLNHVVCPRQMLNLAPTFMGMEFAKQLLLLIPHFVRSSRTIVIMDFIQ